MIPIEKIDKVINLLHDKGICTKNGSLVDFTKKAIRLRKEHPVFSRNRFFNGYKVGNAQDIQWYAEDGSNPDWAKLSRFLAFRLSGAANICSDKDKNYDFFVAANTDRHDKTVKLPTLTDGRKWYRVADTSIEDETSILSAEDAEKLPAQERYVLPSGAMIVLVAK